MRGSLVSSESKKRKRFEVFKIASHTADRVVFQPPVGVQNLAALADVRGERRGLDSPWKWDEKEEETRRKKKKYSLLTINSNI